MIDIEEEVFENISECITELFPNIKVYGEELDIPSSFPCVTFYEFDNTVLESTGDSISPENHAVITFEANVFSNSQERKAECKSILNTIDEKMLCSGFIRILKNEMALEDDTSIYRMFARYRAVVSKDKQIYGGIINNGS